MIDAREKRRRLLDKAMLMAENDVVRDSHPSKAKSARKHGAFLARAVAKVIIAKVKAMSKEERQLFGECTGLYLVVDL